MREGLKKDNTKAKERIQNGNNALGDGGRSTVKGM